MQRADQVATLRGAIAACKAGRHAEALPLALAVLPHAPEQEAVRRAVVVAAAGDGRGASVRAAAAALARHGAVGPALALLEALVGRDAQDVVAWNRLGNLRQKVGRFEEAEAAYRAGLRAGGDDPSLHLNLGVCLMRMDRPAEAARHTEAALAAAPDDLVTRWTDARVLPISYRETAEIARWNHRYRVRLAGVAAAAERASAEAARAALARGWDGFHAHYPCLPDDVGLQRELGRTLRCLAARAWPELDGPTPRPGPRVRVGVVSALMRRHTVGRLFGGWVRELDRARFDVELWHLGPPDDETRALGATCSRFEVRGFDDTAATARDLRAAGLDVLLYPELGMDVPTLRLAALRLAPVQAMAWGHPVTSALPTVDAFLSSAAMEPPDGTSHVSEALVPLPGLGLALEPLPAAPGRRRRADFGLPEGVPVFVNTQSACKLLPSADGVVARIAAAVPEARFVFLAGAGGSGGDVLLARLDAAFRAAGADPARQLHAAGPLDHADFLDLNALSDVFLDGIHWSGGWTTLEALACGAVPLTVPGALMRTRHTAGILDALGVRDTIAEDVDGFVDLAVRLAREPAWRAGVRARLQAALPAMWADRRGLHALEDWLTTAARGGAA